MWCSMTNDELVAIQKRYDATLKGYSSNPGTYLESSEDVPKLLAALTESNKEKNDAIVSALYWKSVLDLAEANAMEIAKKCDRALEVLKRLEFGIFQRFGGREGNMCGVCFKFEREGHASDCWLGKTLAELNEMNK